ncbi:MAG TPA: beta-ketoacyl-ACP synthase III [Pirellulales bacterium]|nr:beta-ketoacyl-ACP synthase III [Pirellulales bacterium]
MSNELTNDNRRAPLRSLTGVQVVATGSYVPECVVTNEDLHARFGFDPSWIVQRTGIRERRHAPPEMATSDLAVRASRQCLERAGAKPADVDLVLVGTFTPDMSFPATACLVQDQLGIRAPAVDLQAACAGFMYALVTGAQFVATGCSKLALVIGADCNSRILNPKDQRTYPLFGDGAGAVLLATGSAEQGLVSYVLGSDGSGGDLLCRRMGGSRTPFSKEGLDSDGQYLQMDGQAVFKWAVRLLDESITAVLEESKLSPADLDLVVLHQANVRIVYAATDVLGIDRKKVFLNLDRYGNTSAGSVPLALDEAYQQGRIRRGSRVLISGFGAGLAWGTAVLRW